VLRKVSCMAVLGLLVSSAAWAKDPKLEISGMAGYSFSDGVNTQTAVTVGGNTYNSLGPTSAFSYSFTVGYNFTENWELEFLYANQQSKLEVSGTNTLTIGDFHVSNYQGIISYNFGDPRAKARPFVFGGAGATTYPGLSAPGLDGQTHSIAGESRFASTWGAGVKIYPGKAVGIRLQARWTPTYINTTSAGWWCDPYWGCYVVGNAQYSNQFELGGGLTLRF